MHTFFSPVSAVTPDLTFSVLAHESDIPSLIEVAKQTFLETYNDFNQNDVNDIFGDTYKKELKELISNQEKESSKELYILAKLGDKLAGYAKLEFNSSENETCKLSKIYFLKKYQGKGYGTQLLNVAYQKARGKNYSKMELEVWKENDAAVNFYEKKGFKIKGEKSVMFSGKEFKDIVMVNSEFSKTPEVKLIQFQC